MTTLIAVSIDFPVELFTITSNARLFKQSFVWFFVDREKKVYLKLFGRRQNNNPTIFAFDLFLLFCFN